MGNTVVYGTLVSRGAEHALATGDQAEILLLLSPNDLKEIDLDLHLDGFTRWQGIPLWSEQKIGRTAFQGTLCPGSLKRARDLTGELQLIREQLHPAGMDVVLFDGKAGWIVGTRPHQRLFYDPQLRNWLCPNNRIDKLIQASIRRKVGYR